MEKKVLKDGPTAVLAARLRDEWHYTHLDVLRAADKLEQLGHEVERQRDLAVQGAALAVALRGENQELKEELDDLTMVYHANGWPGPDGTTLAGQNDQLKAEILEARRCGRVPVAFWLIKQPVSAEVKHE